MKETVVYYGRIPKACDDCYLIRKIEFYVGKVGSICPISGFGRTKGRRSIACPFVCMTEPLSRLTKGGEE